MQISIRWTRLIRVYSTTTPLSTTFPNIKARSAKTFDNQLTIRTHRQYRLLVSYLAENHELYPGKRRKQIYVNIYQPRTCATFSNTNVSPAWRIKILPLLRVQPLSCSSKPAHITCADTLSTHSTDTHTYTHPEVIHKTELIGPTLLCMAFAPQRNIAESRS